MQTIQLLKILEKYPIFTEKDITKITNKNSAYARILLHRIQKKDYILRIERGKYTVHKDPLIFASHIVTPSYLSLWTALKFYSLTEQQPQIIWVISKRKHKNIKFNNINIKFITAKYLFGYKKMRYQDFDIFIAEKEKAILDSIIYKLPLEDISQATKEEINYKKLAEYTKTTKNKSLIKRIGYILEKKTGNPYGLKALDNNYIVLDYSLKKTGKKDSKWKIFVNKSL